MGSESYDGQRSIFLRILLFVCITCLTFSLVSGRLCSDVKAGNRKEEVEVGYPCTQKYTARCGWFSLEYCTFYHHTICNKLVNQTVTFYYVQTWCCPGYVMAENSSCIVNAPGVKYITPEPRMTVEGPLVQEVVKNEENNITVSPGGYAGIACAFVFMCILIVFIINGVRKRQKRKREKDRATEEETGQELIARRLATSPATDC